MISCTATASPVASVPVKTLRPTEPLGAVFAVISSKEKTRAVASEFAPADWAAVLLTAHAGSHSVVDALVSFGRKLPQWSIPLRPLEATELQT
jgi:hypothetical protein